MNRILSLGMKMMRPLILSQSLKCNVTTSTIISMMKPSVSNYNLVISRSMANHRHKKMIKLAKGYRGRANRCYKIAKLRVMKARQYSYRDRKVFTISRFEFPPSHFDLEYCHAYSREVTNY